MAVLTFIKVCGWISTLAFNQQQTPGGYQPAQKDSEEEQETISWGYAHQCNSRFYTGEKEPAMANNHSTTITIVKSNVRSSF